MSQFLLLDELVRQRIHECSVAAHNAFRASVRPIYAAVSRRTPELIGSCILLRVDGTRYVVTAAHVIDHLDSSNLYVGGTVGTEPVQLLGKIISSKAPEGQRNRDHLDLALCQISDDRFRALGEVACIEASDVAKNQASTDHRIYMAMGFPLSRNRGRVIAAKRSIAMTSWRYVEGISPIPALAAEMGVSGHDHFFQRYEKLSKDAGGNSVSSISPRGLSGGATVDLGDFGTVEVFNNTGTTGLLAGMVIEKNSRHRALVSVRIHKILEAISSVRQQAGR